MRSISVLCFAGTPHSAKFAQLAAAEKQVLELPRLALLKQALQGSEAGAEILAPLAQMKAITANDSIGDQRFELASSAWQDDAMLKVCLRGNDAEQNGDSAELAYSVYNSDLVFGSPMMLETMLTDSMANIVESISLWSPSRLELRHDDVRSCV